MHAPLTTTKLACLASIAALAMLSPAALAQATSPASAPSPSTPASSPAQATADEAGSQNNPVVLSPFEVTSTEDTGYRARDTLAGSRINTNLSDIAGPITVVTKDFLNDIGATDIQSVLTYEVGTEGTNEFQSNTPQLGRTSDNAAQDPNGATRGRGLAPFDYTRDYFYSLSDVITGYSAQSVGFDTYNIDSITIVRGADSILAGLGSPAGIINFSPQLAGLERNTYDAAYRIGSYGDQRATFNANVVAIPEVLAFRVALLDKEAAFEAKPSYDNDKRYYLASTYKPFKKTVIHVSFENANVQEHLPATFTPEDDITQWIQLGKPAAPAPAGGGTGTAPATTPIPGTNASFYPDVSTGTGFPYTYYGPNGQYLTTYNNASLYEYQQQNLSNVALWQPLRMSNDEYGNWHDLNTNGTHQKNTLETFEASIDQEVFPNFNLNAAIVHEIANYTELNLGRPDYVADMIDVNPTLPSGAANPNYGDTYMYFSGLDNQNATYSRNTVARAAATYDLDLTKYNKWFGRYVATGFLEHRRTTNDFVDYNANQDGAANSTGQGPGVITYTGGNASNGYYQTSVANVPMLYANAPIMSDKGVTTDAFSTFYALKEEEKDITKLSTSAFVLQGFMFDDLAVGTFGLRRDKDEAGFAGSTTDATSGLILPVPSNEFASGNLSTVQAQTKTAGIVLHGPKLQKVDLSWLSVGYNQSQNFIPNAGSIDLQGNPTPDPTGTTRDRFIAVDLLGGKLNAKIDWFTSVASNAADATVNFPLVQWTLPFLLLANNGENGEGAYYNLAQQAGVQNYQSGLFPGLATGDARLANAYTSSQVSKGMEFELTYNVTRNWRIMGTVTREQAEESNIAPALTAFINNRIAYWQANNIWNSKYTTTQDWCGCPETGQQVFNDQVVGPFIAYQSANGMPSQQLHKWKASLVTNYTFDTGFMKGFGVGTGLRWIDKTIIGDPVVENSSDQVVGLDLAHPYTTPSETSVEMWVTYARKIYHDRFILSFRLEADNLQTSGGYQPVAANSDGTHQLFTIVPPRSFYFTTELRY